MFPRPRYHGGNGPVRYREHDVRVVAGALARLLDQGSMQREWRGASPRPFRRNPWTCPRRPYSYGNQRPDGNWTRFPPKGRPWDWRPHTLPRRGPPVAAIRAPRRYQRDEWETRRPRGSEPRGPLRGGPERSAGDPQRNPRGGLCGGPARSANDTQTPPKTSRAKADGGRAGKAGEKKSPTVVTVDKGGKERS